MRRPSFVVVLLAVGVSVLLVGGGVLLGPASQVPGSSGSNAEHPTTPAAVRVQLPTAALDVARSPGTRAAQVLHGWDEARAHAYATGDVEELARLYAPGSAAGRTDVRVLREYVERGLRVTGMHMQVLSLNVLSRHRDRWTLLVTDRLAGGVAVGGGHRWSLPRDRAGTNRIVLGRGAGRWRVLAVRPARGR